MSRSQTAERERAEALKTLKRGRRELSGIPIILERHAMADGKQTEQSVTCVPDDLRPETAETSPIIAM